MKEVLKDVILSIFIGFGGVSSVFLFFKFVIKKWIEESIKKQMNISMALFEQKINRQDSVFNIRVKREFDCYDSVQKQNSYIKSAITQSIVFLKVGDTTRFYITINDLKETFKNFEDNIESYQAYLDDGILHNMVQISIKLKLLLKCCSEDINFDNIDKISYEKIARKVIIKITSFNSKLKDYILHISDANL